MSSSKKCRVGWAVALAFAALGVTAVPTFATHGGGPSSHVEALGRGAFTDEIDAQFRVKLDGRATEVVSLDEPSDVVTARITLDRGAVIPWHTHPGPVIVTVTAGELTYVDADDCVERPYAAGSVFLDPGQGNVHTAFASGSDGAVLVATFLGVDGPMTVPAEGPAECDVTP